MTTVPLGPLELVDVDHLLSDEERAMQHSVGRLADETIRPNIAACYEEGTFPAEMALTFGKVGLLGMHLQGYGCAGMSAVQYGFACMEPEAGGSGARSFDSVQGSLAMFAIHHRGDQEQKARCCSRCQRSGHRLFWSDRPRLRLRPGRDAHSGSPRRY